MTRILQLAVVQHERVPRLDRFEDLVVRQENAFAVAERLIAIELENRPGRQLDAPGVEIADAELRALQIGEDADRMAMARRAGAHGVVKRFGPIVRRVADVDAEDVNAGNEKTLDHFRGG